ncbi:MAG: assembly factor cbp4 [Chaenotheca gracillima]|nr:MAG: assembly factor cbp4 [Chaenotheca gracillima]
MAPNIGLWVKMLGAGGLMVVGGPLLVQYVTPSEEELFKRYNPDLQKRSLENREQRQEEFNQFVAKLKDYSKSDKPIWVVAAEEDARLKKEREVQQRQSEAEAVRRRAEIKQQAGGS